MQEKQIQQIKPQPIAPTNYGPSQYAIVPVEQLLQLQQKQHPHWVHSTVEAAVRSEKINTESWSFLKICSGVGILAVAGVFVLAALKPTPQPQPIVIREAPIATPSPQKIVQPSCTTLCFGG